MMLKRLFLLSLLSILTACGSPKEATSGPTPEAIRVYYPASLQPWADKLAGCATNDSAVGLYFIQSANASPELGANDFLLEIGQPPQNIKDRYIYQVGWEQVEVIVNQSNPLTQLSTDKLSQIFSGRVTTWENGVAVPIQVWVLPGGEPIRRIFDSALELNQPLAADALLAPDSATMLEVVSKDENAIGYLPQSFLSMSPSTETEKVKLLSLDPLLVEALHQPVLAITQSEPAGHLRDLLVCLQSHGNE